ncbi:MAG TPA: sugar phosphate nucleotidyltransferase, partial [Burkholderiaceae bacterium]|nr:sugar phosphate nucleotidyltransferase [Burkholderiaceae bacterium]
EIIINLAWLGSHIEQTLKDGRQYGARITYSHEATALETAGGIAQALDYFADQPFLVVNADIWCDWDPAAAPGIGDRLQQLDKSAWLLLTDNPPQHPQGDFCLDPSGAVMDKTGRDAITLTFCGIGVYRPTLFRALPRQQPAPLAPLLRSAMIRDEVIGDHHRGCWTDVGTPQRLAELNDRLSRFG